MLFSVEIRRPSATCKHLFCTYFLLLLLQKLFYYRPFSKNQEDSLFLLAPILSTSSAQVSNNTETPFFS